MGDYFKYYLYIHIRLDKNEVFYVGVGTKNQKGYYTRSQVKSNRNKFWKRIVAKTNYKREIIEESNDYKYLLNKEIELIKLYGRRDLGLGTLVNLTNGGEGTTEYICTKETKVKISNSHKGKKPSTEHIKALVTASSEANKKPIIQYDLNGCFLKEWKYIREASKKLKIKEANISANIRGISSYCGYSIWKFKTQNYPLNIEVSEYIKKLKLYLDKKERLKNKDFIKFKKIIITDTETNQKIVYDSLKDCEEKTGFTNITRAITNKNLYRKRFKLEYLLTETQKSFK